MALYNLNISEDTMIHQCQAPNARGLNKVKFDKSGNLVAVASLDGTVFVWDVTQLVVVAQDDANKFARLIRKQ
jgi:WD40 repeat protein